MSPKFDILTPISLNDCKPPSLAPMPFFGFTDDVDHTEILLSADALLLVDLLQCKGMSIEKAKLFYMIVQPGFDEEISVYDKDMKQALFFMISMSTVLEEMTQDLIANTSIDGTGLN